MPDHIHILFRLSKNIALSQVMEEVKKSSSLWAKTKGVPGFTWQIGYGAFSVSDSNLEVVKRYTRNQNIINRFLLKMRWKILYRNMTWIVIPFTNIF